jgi:hypothetical protein
MKRANVLIVLAVVATSALAADFGNGSGVRQTRTVHVDPLLQLSQFPLTDSTIDLLPVIGPRYSVIVHADGRVVFNGSYLVKTLGAASHMLSKAEFAEFRQVLDSLHLETIRSSREHSHYAVLVIATPSGAQEIRFDESNTERYVDVRSRLEKYLRTMDYRCPVEVVQPEIATMLPDVCGDIFELRSLRNNASKWGK